MESSFNTGLFEDGDGSSSVCIFTKIVRSALGPPAAGGIRRTTSGTPGRASRSPGASNTGNYPDVPDRSSAGSAALAVDAEEELSSTL